MRSRSKGCSNSSVVAELFLIKATPISCGPAGIFTVAVPNGVTVALGLGEADLLLESLAELSLRELLERLG